MANSISSLWKLLNCQKVCISISERNMLPDEPILGGRTGLLVAHLLLGIFHRVNPDNNPRSKLLTCGIILLRVWHLSPMIGGTCMCLSVVFLVNKSHYWFGKKGKMATFVVKHSVIIRTSNHSVRWWPIVYPPYGSYLTARKYVFPYQNVICCQVNLSLVVEQVYVWHTCYLGFSTGLTLITTPDPSY